MVRLPPTPILETIRLIVRPLHADDAPSIQRRFPRWDVVRYLSAHVPWPYPFDGAASHVAHCLGQKAGGEKFFWAITLKGGPVELIGGIELWPDDGVSRDQRGFWLDPEFQGQGLMTAAAERVTELRLPGAGLAASLAHQRRGQPAVRTDQREAGCAADRPRALPPWL